MKASYLQTSRANYSGKRCAEILSQELNLMNQAQQLGTYLMKPAGLP
jgi:hypothetical protein